MIAASAKFLTLRSYRRRRWSFETFAIVRMKYHAFLHGQVRRREIAFGANHVHGVFSGFIVVLVYEWGEVMLLPSSKTSGQTNR